MKFLKKIYLGTSIKKKKKKIIWKLKTHATLLDVYVFALPADGTELEYFNSCYLKQKYYLRNKPLIVGIAQGLDEVEDILEQLLKDSFQKSGTYDINAYVHSLV